MAFDSAADSAVKELRMAAGDAKADRLSTVLLSTTKKLKEVNGALLFNKYDEKCGVVYITLGILYDLQQLIRSAGRSEHKATFFNYKPTVSNDHDPNKHGTVIMLE